MVGRPKCESEKTRQKILDSAHAVFLEHGVSRSTFADIASAAGMTRGAIYWHFKNKIDLFEALIKDAFLPLEKALEDIFDTDEFEEPLDRIEKALRAFASFLECSSKIRQLYEIVLLRCEAIGAFSDARSDAEGPAKLFLLKIESFYQLAADRGTLSSGIDPFFAAQDTYVFTQGILHLMLSRPVGSDFSELVQSMIHGHMNLRRILEKRSFD